MLAASNGAAQRSNMAPALEPVVRQLKDIPPFAVQRTVMTLIYRVSDGGTVESRGALPLVVSSGPASQRIRDDSKYQLRLGRMRWEPNAAEKNAIAFDLNFTHRIPVVAVESGREVVVHEDAALQTRTSVREGEPTVLGTLTSSNPGEVYILAVIIKRATR